MKKKLMILVALIGFGICANAQSPENVARKFCTAVFNKDMVKAKSFMTIEDARRTPDKMSFSYEEGRMLLSKLNNASFKIIKNEYTDKIVTVRYYDSKLEYLAKNNRWLCCSIELANNNGNWQVTSYGY
ncbi:MAG: hypothetical protein LBS69_13030 [Prevotellaceae bacterium]|nr:hypothetical protein [Prevotellaceae bacterium]